MPPTAASHGELDQLTDRVTRLEASMEHVVNDKTLDQLATLCQERGRWIARLDSRIWAVLILCFGAVLTGLVNIYFNTKQTNALAGGGSGGHGINKPTALLIDGQP